MCSIKLLAYLSLPCHAQVKLHALHQVCEGVCTAFFVYMCVTVIAVDATAGFVPTSRMLPMHVNDSSRDVCAARGITAFAPWHCYAAGGVL